MTELEKLKEIELQIKELEQKKATLTDTTEIKAVNKQIKTLQIDFERLSEKRKNEKALLDAIEDFEIKEITTTYDGEQLKGSYNYEEGTLFVIMEQPFPSISTIVAFPETSFEEYAESQAKELLIKLYKDNK